MEFFEWFSAQQTVLSLFNWMRAETAEELISLMQRVTYICLGVAGGLTLLVLVMGGLGLMRMAKHANIGHRWMGFVPFLNTYYAGKIAGEANFFGQKMKRAGLYAMLVELVYTAVNVFSIVATVLLRDARFYNETVTEAGERVLEFALENVPLGMRWLATAGTWCSVLSYLLYFVMLVFFCVVYFALFRKYYARSPFLMTFLSSILPARGFVLFAVRNNAPVDYNAYMRSRMEELARRRASVYGPAVGPGAYGGADGSPQQAGSPFYEFGQETPPGKEGTGGAPQEEPFSEFDDTSPKN